MAIFTPGKKGVSFRELKRLTKSKGWISRQDRLALLQEAKKYSSRGISKWEMRKKILPSLKYGTKETIKRWEVPRIKKGLLEK